MRGDPVIKGLTGGGQRLAGIPLPGIAFLLCLFSVFFSYFVLTRYGVQFLVLSTVGLTAMVVLLYVSYTNLYWSVMLWVFSMIILRSVAVVRMPGLPDFSPDRFLTVWIFVLFLIRLLTKKDKRTPPFAAEILLWVHTLYILVQLNVMGSIHIHAWTISNASPLVAFICGKYFFKDEKSLRNLLFFFVIVLFYYSFTSIAEHFDVQRLVWPRMILNSDAGQIWQPGRSRGPVMHPPLFGQLLGMLFLLNFYFLTSPINRFFKIIVSGLAFMSGLALLYTYTRGPWLATAVAIVFLAVIRPSYRKLFFIVALLCILAGAFGLFQMANSEFLQERLEEQDTVSNRLIYLATAMRMIAEHPVFGVGFFRYTTVRDDYLQGTDIPFYGYVKIGYGARVSVHDIYIGRFADEGVISMVLLISFSILVLREFKKKWAQNPQGRWYNRDLLALFAGIMVCYHVGGMVIDFRFFDQINVIYMLLAGIIYGFKWMEEPEAEELSAGGRPADRAPKSLLNRPS